MTTYASMCTGVGGLDRAIEELFDADPMWFCEFNAACRAVLERHWPGVPIYEDVKTQDWSQVSRVDILCAGYPCQPFSHAGQRKGTDDPRHLWPFIRDAIRVLRPRVVVLENVAGHVSLGLDTVLADLAALGFDAEWGVLRASDVGACHQRARLFIVATDTRCERHGRGQDARGVGRLDREDAGEARQRERAWPVAVDGGADAADSDSDGCARGPEQHSEPTPRLDGQHRRHPDRRGVEDAQAGPGGSGSAPSDAENVGRQRRGAARRRRIGSENVCGAADDPAGDSGREQHGERHGATWGDYGPAIDRHARAVGRVAPAPTDERGRLSVLFVEWMQMLPEGWVDGMTRTQALTALGNCVVTPQAVHAIKELMSRA